MTELSAPVPTYTTPDLVAETMGLPDPEDELGVFRFSDTTNPTYDFVCRMIVSAEGEIDRLTNQSWRENHVKNQILTINTYQWDANAWRVAYYQRGGNYLKLRKNVRPWDPQKGDKLELRTRNNAWREITYNENNQEPNTMDADGFENAGFWIDHEAGRLFIRTRLFQPTFNSARISYRYGREEDPPYELQRLCSLMVADRIIQMGIYSIKIGMGGDIAGIKQDLHRSWQEEMSSLFSSIQRSGSVHSLLG